MRVTTTAMSKKATILQYLLKPRRGNEVNPAANTEPRNMHSTQHIPLRTTLAGSLPKDDL